MPFLGGLQQRLLGGLEALVSNGSSGVSLPQPDTIPGLALWLRGDSSTNTGTVLNSLIDKSSVGAIYTNTNSTHLWTFNASDSSFNNQPTISSASTATLMSPDRSNAGYDQPFTIYAACTNTLRSGYQIIITNSTDNTEFGFANSTLYLGGPENNFTSVDSNPHLVCGIFDGTNLSAYIDDANTALAQTSGSGVTGNLSGTHILLGYVGQSDAFVGTIAEVLVYTGAHTTAQRDTIFAYMAQRYNKPQWNNPAFSPLDLSPLAWFASDSGVTNVSGNVSQWLDQSGNNHTLTQSTGANRPVFNTSGGLNGKPRLTCSGSDFLSNTSFTRATSSPVEIFAVATTTSSGTAGIEALVDLGNQTNLLYQFQNNTQLSFANGSSIGASPNMVVGQAFIADVSQDGSGNGSAAINCGIAATGSVGTTSQGATDITIGSYNNQSSGGWIGDIYEVVVLPAQVDNGQRDNLYDYFIAKYGIQVPAYLAPTAWYDASKGVTETLGLVTGWADQSGNGYNLTINAGATSPAYTTSGINNLPAISYTEVTTMGLHNASLPITAVMDVFVVATSNVASATSNNYLFGSSSVNGYAIAYMIESATEIAITQDNGTHNVDTGDLTENAPYIIEANMLGTTSSQVLLNGSVAATGNAGTGGTETGMTIGHAGGANTSGNFSWGGLISEVLVFNYTLSEYQRQQVVSYLADKYGITPG